MGRPTDYTEELADKICVLIATSAKSMKTIGRELGVHPATIHRWLNENATFRDKYARAKEDQADFLAEEILDIADDSSNDTKVVNKNGEVIEVENTEWVNRSKLRVDARKWVASKLKPKKYGDKIGVDHSGKIDGVIFKGIDLNVPKDDSTG